MISGIRKITYNNDSDTYLIITDDKERCGYPLIANSSLNRTIYDQLKVKMQKWTHVTHERNGCFDIVHKLENANITEKEPPKTLTTVA